MVIQLKTRLKIFHDRGATEYPAGTYANYACKPGREQDEHRLHLYDRIMARTQTHICTTKPGENPPWL